MKGLLSIFRRQAQPPKALQSAPAMVSVLPQRLAGVELFYRPSLVAELKKDHELLLQQYEAMATAHRAEDHKASVQLLQAFTATLRGHLLKENLHLYVYLKHALGNDLESSSLLNSMRQEMAQIGRDLNLFVTSYTSAAWTPKLHALFGGDIDAIAGVLGRRIKQEEDSLYPLYGPPSQYDLAG